MKRLLLLFFCFLASVSFLWAGRNGVVLKDVQYEISAGGVAKQGKNLVKVSVTVRKRDIGYCAAAAVHGVLFTGYASADGIRGQKPMISQQDAEIYEDFFKNFFDSKDGTFSDYAEVVSGTTVSTKIKGGYRIEAVVEVNKASLRKYLESNGVLKRMSEIL